MAENNNDLRSSVKVVMSSGIQHEFEMTNEKSMHFVHVVTGSSNEVKKWVDVWDYTDAMTGQFLLDLNKVESVYIEPTKE